MHRSVFFELEVRVLVIDRRTLDGFYEKFIHTHNIDVVVVNAKTGIVFKF